MFACLEHDCNRKHNPTTSFAGMAAHYGDSFIAKNKNYSELGSNSRKYQFFSALA